MVDGVVGEQGFLVLDALGLGLVLVLILLAQPCIDGAKDLSHLLNAAGGAGPGHHLWRALASQAVMACRRAWLGGSALAGWRSVMRKG